MILKWIAILSLVGSGSCHVTEGDLGSIVAIGFIGLFGVLSEIRDKVSNEDG